MKDKAGTMPAAMVWAFAIGSVVLATILSKVGLRSGIAGILQNVALYMAGGYLAVFLTKSSTGKGILAFLAAGAVSGIISVVMVKMAMADVGDAVKTQVAAAGSTGNAQLNAQLAEGASAVASGLGAIAMAGAFFLSLIWCFLFGMVGCFIGGSMKKSALGGGAAQAKAA